MDRSDKSSLKIEKAIIMEKTNLIFDTNSHYKSHFLHHILLLRKNFSCFSNNWATIMVTSHRAFCCNLKIVMKSEAFPQGVHVICLFPVNRELCYTVKK